MKQKMNFNLIGTAIMSRSQFNANKKQEVIIVERLRELLISKMEKGWVTDRDKVTILLDKIINEILK